MVKVIYYSHNWNVYNWYTTCTCKDFLQKIGHTCTNNQDFASFTHLGVNQLKIMFPNFDPGTLKAALDHANDSIFWAVEALLDGNGECYYL